MSTLIIAPAGTNLTVYTSQMAVELYQRLNALDTKRPLVRFLGEPFAVQPTLSWNRILVSMQPDKGRDTIVYYGHGTPASLVGTPVMGTDFSPSNMVVAGLNDAVLAGAIVITISCKTLQQLARTAVGNGAISFAGSMEDMWVGHDQSSYDYFADFTTLFNILPFSFVAEGKSLGESLRIYRSMGKLLLSRYENMSGPLAVKHADFVRKNLKYYDVVGDKDVRYYG